MPKPVADRMAVYAIGPESQHLIDETRSRWFRPTLRVGDVALCLGGGEYLLLRVTDTKIQGLAQARFTAKPMGVLVPWSPRSESDFYALLAGQSLRDPGLALALQAMQKSSPAMRSVVGS